MMTVDMDETEGTTAVVIGSPVAADAIDMTILVPADAPTVTIGMAAMIVVAMEAVIAAAMKAVAVVEVVIEAVTRTTHLLHRDAALHRSEEMIATICRQGTICRLETIILRRLLPSIPNGEQDLTVAVLGTNERVCVHASLDKRCLLGKNDGNHPLISRGYYLLFFFLSHYPQKLSVFHVFSYFKTLQQCRF